jgi:uncharacterized coiled-coil DUF342 family protein
MSLLCPTPGQVIDRISILALKIDSYRKAKRNEKSLLEELLELEAFLDSQEKHSPEITELSRQLASTNQELWDCEDEIRAEDEANDYCLSRIALEIVRLNDLRSKLITQLDLAYSCPSPTEEKIYRL